jgi:hypothetical protein
MSNKKVRNTTTAKIVENYGSVTFFAAKHGFRADAVRSFIKGRTNGRLVGSVAYEIKRVLRRENLIGDKNVA